MTSQNEYSGSQKGSSAQEFSLLYFISWGLVLGFMTGGALGITIILHGGA